MYSCLWFSTRCLTCGFIIELSRCWITTSIAVTSRSKFCIFWIVIYLMIFCRNFVTCCHLKCYCSWCDNRINHCEKILSNYRIENAQVLLRKRKKKQWNQTDKRAESRVPSPARRRPPPPAAAQGGGDSVLKWRNRFYHRIIIDFRVFRI